MRPSGVCSLGVILLCTTIARAQQPDELEAMQQRAREQWKLTQADPATIARQWVATTEQHHEHVKDRVVVGKPSFEPEAAAIVRGYRARMAMAKSAQERQQATEWMTQEYAQLLKRTDSDSRARYRLIESQLLTLSLEESEPIIARWLNDRRLTRSVGLEYAISDGYVLGLSEQWGTSGSTTYLSPSDLASLDGTSNTILAGEPFEEDAYSKSYASSSGYSWVPVSRFAERFGRFPQSRLSSADFTSARREFAQSLDWDSLSPPRPAREPLQRERLETAMALTLESKGESDRLEKLADLADAETALSVESDRLAALEWAWHLARTDHRLWARRMSQGNADMHSVSGAARDTITRQLEWRRSRLQSSATSRSPLLTGWMLTHNIWPEANPLDQVQEVARHRIQGERTPIETLQREVAALLEWRHEFAQREFQRGKATLQDLAELVADMLEAELTLTQSPEQRLRLLFQIYEQARELERLERYKFEIRCASVGDLAWVVAARLEIEHRIVTLRKSMP